MQTKYFQEVGGGKIKSRHRKMSSVTIVLGLLDYYN